MLWITFSLLAALLWASVNIIDKYTMSKLVGNPMVPLLVMGIIGLFAAVVIYFTHDFPLFSLLQCGITFLAGAFYLLTTFFYYHAMKRDDVSRIIPLYYLAPVFILFIAQQLFNEALSYTQYVGMVFLVCGAVLISAPYPFKFRLNTAAGFMILAALCYAVNQISTKWLLKEQDYWIVFAYVRISIFICLIPALIWALTRALTQFQTITYRAYAIMSINQVLNLAGVLSITLALTYGYVTLVNALTSVQPLFVFILATLLSVFYPQIIKEENSRAVFMMKGLAIALMFCGTLMVS